MSRITSSLACALVVTGAVVAQAAPAHAKAVAPYAPPTVKTLPVVVADAANGTAVVRATYTCFGGHGGHLYIGVKQGPDVNATDHSTSDFANTFYSTNYNADGPGLTLTCDGKQHTQGFVVAPDPFFPYKHPNPAPLAAGPVFVQFCIFDATSNFDEENPTGFGFDYSMKKAVLG